MVYKIITDWTQTGIKDRVINEIREHAKTNHVEKVILFGSRARGDFRPKSDIDLAVLGGDVANFSMDVDEDTWTLLEYDFVDLGRGVSAELMKEIERDGILIYEKV